MGLLYRTRKLLGYQKWFWFQGGRAQTAYPRAVARLQRRSTRHLRQLPPIPLASRSDVSIHLLCGHKQTPMAIFALHSFLRHADAATFSATVHSDGSLTAADRSTLTHFFPGVKILEKSEGQRVMHASLPGPEFAHLRRFRDTHLFGPKLVDPHLTSSASTLLLLDTDILFLRRPTDLFDRLGRTAHDGHLTSFRDAGPHYSAPPDVLESTLGLRPAPALNAGLVAMPRFTADDFRLVDALLSRMPAGWIDDNFFAEQTLYALLAGQKGWHPLPDAYRIAPATVTTSTAVHYVSSARKEFFTEGVPYLLQPAPGPSMAASAPAMAV